MDIRYFLVEGRYLFYKKINKIRNYNL